ncbi:MAG: VOC family protein [Nocardioides sp.]|uniref:VOC family protein n=1 Tax=Nocardioides nematodiphilus TaxID=2849669 RepID=UPI001CD9B71E|nr:VOC family protein [Nocardioides nematodiphilus]MCA1982518.1 VOC family protein [Nocardioides nematodiphilus]
MTTINSIATAMFSVSDQDAAIAFYTQKLGWELRSEVSFGEGADAGRWVEVAPPGSATVLALNPPMNGEPGGGSIGVETSDVDAEREALSAAGVQVGEMMGGEGPVPKMFSANDPDNNWIWVVQQQG